jgi:PBP1b-binding outer membrane lipoprotein LpoB
MKLAKEFKMDLMKRLFLMVFLVLPLAACDSNDGPAEKVGKNVDEATDKIKEGVEDACEKATDENC